MAKSKFERDKPRCFAALISAVAAVVLFASPAFAGTGAAGDVMAEWCLDSEAKEIYAAAPDGARESLILSEAVVVDGEIIDAADTARVFDEGLAEAIDGADALDTSFAADAWETVVELIYGHDAFGQRIETVGAETTNEAGHRCRMLKAPGFATMFRAFSENFGS